MASVDCHSFRFSKHLYIFAYIWIVGCWPKVYDPKKRLVRDFHATDALRIEHRIIEHRITSTVCELPQFDSNNTPYYYSLYGVVEFILHIIIPCTGSWSLYSILLFPARGRGVYTPYYYSLSGVVEFILHIIIP